MKQIFSQQTRQLADRHARYNKVFSSPQRVLILWLLMESEKTVSEIAEAIGASRPRTSQHLLIMKHGNILEAKRVQKYTYYRIVDNEFLKSYPLVSLCPKK